MKVHSNLLRCSGVYHLLSISISSLFFISFGIYKLFGNEILKLKQLSKKLELRKEKERHYRITIPDWKNKVTSLDGLIRGKKGEFIAGSKIKIEKRPIRKFIEKYKLFNKLSIEKEIPVEITKLPKEKLSLFLNRLFSCDGSIYPIENNGWEISYCSSSEKLIKIVQNLILRFGILSKLRNKTIKLKGKYSIVLN